MSQPHHPPPAPGSPWRPPLPPPGQNPFAPGSAGAGQLPGGPPDIPATAGTPHQFGYHSQYSANGQHDPTRAFGAPPPASVSIDTFAEPPSRANWIIAGVVGLIVIIMVVAALTLRNNDNRGAQPTPTPTPSANPSVVPSAVAAGRALPFESKLDDATGYWEIKEAKWTADGLELTIFLRLDSGSMSWTFFAMDATDTTVFDAEGSGGSDDISSGTLNAKQSKTGAVFFRVPRHTMLIVLTDSSQRQIATLSVSA